MSGKKSPKKTPEQRRKYDKNPRRLTHGECLQAFLEMGEGRTCEGLWKYLQDKYKKQKVKIPCKQTLKKYRHNHSWDQQADEFDGTTKHKIDEILSKEQIEEMINLTGGLRDISVLGLRLLKARIMELPVHNTRDAKLLADVVTTCVNLHESLRGSITEKEDEQDEKTAADIRRENLTRLQGFIKTAAKQYSTTMQ